MALHETFLVKFVIYTIDEDISSKKNPFILGHLLDNETFSSYDYDINLPNTSDVSTAKINRNTELVQM
jgi:hypothetical protein